MLCAVLCSCFTSCINEGSVTDAESFDTDEFTDTLESAVNTSDDTADGTSGEEDTDSLDATDTEEAQTEYEPGYYASHKAGYVTMAVNNIMQEYIGMPYGCEVVSLAMTLGYYGFTIEPRDLFNGYMPHAPYGVANPFYQYVGDATNRTGYGCYAPCVVETANKYLEEVGSSRRAHDISGSSIYEILGYIWNGVPVIIWGTLDMKYSNVIASWNFDGETVNWYSLSHCLVITGVLEDGFIVCDPMVGRIKYTIDEVRAAYEQIYSQAVVIY